MRAANLKEKKHVAEFLECAVPIARRSLQNVEGKRVFVAFDLPDVRDEALAMLRATAPLVHRAIVTTPGDPGHTTGYFEYFNDERTYATDAASRFDPARQAAVSDSVFRKALLDFFMLARCDSLLVPISSTWHNLLQDIAGHDGTWVDASCYLHHAAGWS